MGMSRALAVGIRMQLTNKEYAASLIKILNCYNWYTAPVYFGIQVNADSFADAIIARMKRIKRTAAG